MVASVTEKRVRTVFPLHLFLSATFAATLLALSCSPSESQSLESESAESVSQSPFPVEKFNRAKQLIQEGFSLYCSAMQEEDQTERDRILERVLQEYYFPAQSILSAIGENFRTGDYAAGVDSVSADLNRKIDGVVRDKGAPRGD